MDPFWPLGSDPCRKCGVAIADRELHARWHDTFSLVAQRALGWTDEQYDRYTDDTAAARDARLEAVGDDLLRNAGAAPEGT